MKNLKNHRFLHKLDSIFKKGLGYVVLLGQSHYLKDKFYCVYDSSFKSLSDTIIEYLSRKNLKYIIRIFNSGGKVVFNQLKGDFLSKKDKIIRDDLSEYNTEKKIDTDIVETTISDSVAIVNNLQNITKLMQKEKDYSIGVLFEDFLEITKGFSNSNLQENIIEASLVEWQKYHQYSIFVIRGSDCKNIENFLEKDEKGNFLGVVKIFGPTLYEVSFNISKISAEKDILLLYPLRTAQKLIDECEDANLVSIAKEFEEKISYINTRRINLVGKDWSMNDVILDDDKKEEIKKVFERFLRGEKERGLILYGPPGTGKTSIIKALANESGIFFKKVSGADLKGQYIGESMQKVRNIFEELESNSTAILLIDEADSVLAPRRGGDKSGDTYTNEIVSEFLSWIDGIKSNSRIFVVLTTNYVDKIDEAVQSRLKLIEIPLPTGEQLEKLVKKYIGEKFVKDSCKLNGFSGRDIEHIGREIKEGKDFENSVLKAADRKITPELRKLGLDLKYQIEFGFDCIYGYKKIKQKLKNFIQRGIKTIIFYGPPGTGKTFFTQAYAKELDAYYLLISGREIVEGIYSIKEVIAILQPLLNLKKVLINIDEFDSIAQKGSSFIRSSIIEDMDLMLNIPNLIFTATTNYIENIDDAILRRFKRKLEITLPDKEVFEELIEKEFPEFLNEKEELSQYFIKENFIIEKVRGYLEDKLDENDF